MSKTVFDSPPPYIRIPAGQYRRPSFPDGPPGYVPCDPVLMPRYGSSTASDPLLGVPSIACPACRVGVLINEYSCFSICCLFFCFPLLAERFKRCNNCGAYFR